MPEHETNLNPAINGGTYVCGNHEPCMTHVFNAIGKKIGYVQLVWIVSVLMGVVGGFGVWIWNRTDRVEVAAIRSDKDLAVLKTDLNYIKKAQADTQQAQRALREDMKREFDRLYRTLKNGGSNP